jgi:hypothetical protein
VTDRIQALQAKLKLSTNRSDILSNQALLAAELTYLDEQRKFVEALQRTNQELCKHPHGRSYADPRYPNAFDCRDCGISR